MRGRRWKENRDEGGVPGAPGEVIVAQLTFAITSIFYAAVLVLGYYKDLGEEFNKTE